MTVALSQVRFAPGCQVQLFKTAMLQRLCEVGFSPPVPNQSVTLTHIDCSGEKIGRTSPAPNLI